MSHRPFLSLATVAITLAAVFSPRLSSNDARAENARLTVQVDRPGAKISPVLWGIFFEDINCSADGGIYAELVRNRSFEDSAKPDHWSVVGEGSARAVLDVDLTQAISPKNPHSLKVTLTASNGERAGVANDGFWGVALERGRAYRLSLCARGGEGFAGPVSVSLESKSGQVYAQQTVPALTAGWRRYSLPITAKGTDPQARLVISATKPGTFWLDMVSLFPAKTWKGHGLRPDLCQMLVGLKPSFVRFPGGCWVEGDTMPFAYRWKQTIGDTSERRTQFNIWNYHATHGLGFHEYLQMCEDLEAEPLFVINCGMSHRENIPLAQMREYVQDALDAIEYCNGPPESPWGAVRARQGHPAPFHLKYLEVGNENGGPAYQERYALFYDAIKARYPEMILIANVPTDRRPADVVDEHYYNNPEFFIQQAARYDKYPRSGPKIYIGEYAVTLDCGLGNLRGAVGEAAFMTGIERNADIVAMASYAPLFVNVNHRGWNPDLIGFDSSRAYGIPSYYVQKMFSDNRGEIVLPIEVESPVVTNGPAGGAIGVGTWLTQAEFKDIKVTRDGQILFACDFANNTAGWKLLGGDWNTQDGTLGQRSNAENVRAVAGDKTWTDYTYSLKARKLSGAEGLLILFRVQDENQKSWWNLGGWGNQRHAIEMSGIVDADVPGRIETGRWYDIRIELKGPNIKCYLDGKLVHDVNYQTMKTLCASAAYAPRSGEVILKVVNTSARDQSATLRLDGTTRVGRSARSTVLASAQATDENSLEQPAKVVPVTRNIAIPGPRFDHAFPANSVTVLRLKAKP